jgi:hypothetical protein
MYNSHIKFGTIDNFLASFSISCKVVIYLWKQVTVVGVVIMTAQYTARAVCTGGAARERALRALTLDNFLKN